MFGVRAASVLVLNVALAALTFGCSDQGAGPAGNGGEGGIGGEIAANFETSLHKTRVGQEFWYAASNNGIESLVNVDYNTLECKNCHDNNADPNWTEPTCGDCHADPGAGGTGGMMLAKHLDPATCLGCHGRQRAELDKFAARDMGAGGMGGSSGDVHTAAFDCADCHKSNDVHGNGTEYDSLLRPGAIAARCEDCHTGANAPMTSSYHSFGASGNHNDVDCSLCHMETVISCVNCHFDTEVDQGMGCPQIQVFDWKFAMKWEKDGASKYHPATIMTLKYNCDRPQTDPPFPACAGAGGAGGDGGDPKKTFAVLAPFYGHTVTKKAMTDILDNGGCAYCHEAQGQGDADDICGLIRGAGFANAKQKLIRFTPDGAGGAGGAPTGTLSNALSTPSNPRLIPLPPDYRDRFEIDFAEFADGAGTACAPGGKPVVFFETGPDLWQTGADTNQFRGQPVQNKEELGRPLTEAEMQKFCSQYQEGQN